MIEQLHLCKAESLPVHCEAQALILNKVPLQRTMQ